MASLQVISLVHGFIKQNAKFETIEDKFRIPKDIENLIRAFFGSLFGSKILTLKEEISFMDTVSKHKKCEINNSFKLLYRGSENEYSAKRFHDLCDGQAPTFTIIQTEFGNVCGGYTEQKWMSTTQYLTDKNAFLFLIRSNDEYYAPKCPMIFECKSPEFAILPSRKNGPTFGSGSELCIVDKCHKEYIFTEGQENEFEIPLSYCYRSSSDDYRVDGETLCGGNAVPNRKGRIKFFRVVEYEIFLVE